MGESGPIFLHKGFRFPAVTAGLKASGKRDLALIVPDSRPTAAALFTKNRIFAAPLEVGRAALAKSGGRVRAVLVNSGNANCATGQLGLRACRATCAAAARLLGARPREVFPSSTAIIAVPLPVAKITSQLKPLIAGAGASIERLRQFADAILTTDSRPTR